MINLILLLILAYLLGSIPTAVWLGKIFFHKDVRDFGSRNSGATNTLRTFGLGMAIPVLFFDLFKAYLATKLVFLLNGYSDETLFHYSIAMGLSATIGHIFPVFARFRGGKGIACITGVLFGISPLPALICVGCFLIIVIISKWVSLGSILTAFSLPFILFFLFNERDVIFLSFGVAVFIIVILTHRRNLQRIFAGQENTISFRRKNSRNS